MPKRLSVLSPYPNLRGKYTESGSNEGRASFVRDASQGDGSATWIFHSAKFGRGPSWYFGRSLPHGGSLSSFCCSVGDAVTPEAAQWPPEDIAKVVDCDVPDVDMVSGETQSPGTTPASTCADCRDLSGLAKGMLCASCTASSDKPALRALSLLKDYASSTARERLANMFVSGDSEARDRLYYITTVFEEKAARPIILAEPPPSIELGAGTIVLNCEACCFSGGKLQYQWWKNGNQLPRAERPRFLFCNAGPQDEGSYVCQVFAGGQSVSTRPCEVSLSFSATASRAEDAARRARYESPLRRAAEAERLGKVEISLRLLNEALEAAEGIENVCAEALCKRAELLCQLGRWADAYRDGSAAVKTSPGLARAHAARGTAAMKLGHLAEAASSWETAELLGGVPMAAQEAERCRKRLQEFFAERQAEQSAERQRAERQWRQNAEGASTTSSSGRGHGGGGYSRRPAPPPLAQAMQQNLKLLGLPCDVLPSDDAVRKAYRRLALQAHPDKPGGSKVAFQQLQNAYEAVLSAI